MITNADITVFNSFLNHVTRLKEWKRTVIKGVWFHSDNKINLTDKGVASADVFKVRIPVSADFGTSLYVPPNEYKGDSGTWTLKNDDYVVHGELASDIEKPADLQALSPQYFKITSWADNRFGGLKHWRIGGV